MISSCDEDLGPEETGTFVKFYGNINNNQAVDFFQTSTGEFFLLGNETLDEVDSTMVLIQTDAFGNVMNTITFGDTINEQAKSMIITSGQEILILGSKTLSNGTKDILLYRTDLSGNIQGSQTFGNPNTNEIAVDIKELSDGNLVVLGHTDSLGNGFDMTVFKLDLNLQEIWSKQYGLINADDFGVEILEEGNGDLVWLGNIKRTQDESTRLVRSNQVADVLRDEKYINSNVEVASDLKRISGGYLISGNIFAGGESRIMIKRTDLQFNELTGLSLVIDNGNDEQAASITLTFEGNYLIGGSTNFTDDADNIDMFLLVLDQLGNEVIPRKTFGGLQTGVDEKDQGVKVIQTLDGGFALLGNVHFGNNKMMALIKTDDQGELAE